jgi:uncharacterized YigZ family protein
LKTVTQIYKSDYRIKGSKFLGYLMPASSQDEADLALERVKQEHPTATHHCYAWRIDPNSPDEFEQDDGEPKGTAGMPILNAMKSAELINAIIISVRYYGGTKLGKSGLIDAYGTSARTCIDNAELHRVIPVRIYQINYAYGHQGLIDKFKNDFPLIELDASYLESATCLLGCPEESAGHFDSKLRASEHLFLEVDRKGRSYHVKK